jgi:hypothetical protein
MFNVAYMLRWAISGLCVYRTSGYASSTRIRSQFSNKWAAILPDLIVVAVYGRSWNFVKGQSYDKCITYTTTSVNYSFLTYSKKQSPTWEANRCLTSPENPHILWNPKVYYPTHKCPPHVPILSNIDPIHDLTSHFLKIHFNVIFPSTLGYSQLLSCRFLDHTQRRATVGRTPLDEWLARRRDLYQTAHNTHNRK